MFFKNENETSFVPKDGTMLSTITQIFQDDSFIGCRIEIVDPHDYESERQQEIYIQAAGHFKHQDASVINIVWNLYNDDFWNEKETQVDQIFDVIEFLSSVSDRIETLRLKIWFESEANLNTENMNLINHFAQVFSNFTHVKKFSLIIDGAGQASEEITKTIVSFFINLPNKTLIDKLCIRFGNFELMPNSSVRRDLIEYDLQTGFRACKNVNHFELVSRFISFRLQKNLDIFPKLKKVDIRLKGTSEDFSCVGAVLKNSDLEIVQISVEAISDNITLPTSEWSAHIKKLSFLKHLELHLKFNPSLPLSQKMCEKHEKQINDFKANVKLYHPNASITITYSLVTFRKRTQMDAETEFFSPATKQRNTQEASPPRLEMR